jgi:hypothetical protein
VLYPVGSTKVQQAILATFKKTKPMNGNSTFTWFKLPTALITQPKFQRLSPIAQAGYITLCCVYWQDSGVMTYEDAKMNAEGVDELIERGYIQAEDGMISVPFLDEQINEVEQMISKKKAAGVKSAEARAKQKPNNSSTPVQHVFNTCSTDKIREDKKEIREEEIDRKIDRKKEAPAYAVVLPWETDSFLHIWNIWCTFRTKELNKPKYKEMGEQAALKKLSEMAGGDEATAHKIIEQSIANAWQGLFELKTNKANYNGKEPAVTDQLKRNLANSILNGDFKYD